MEAYKESSLTIVPFDVEMETAPTNQDLFLYYGDNTKLKAQLEIPPYTTRKSDTTS